MTRKTKWLFRFAAAAPSRAGALLTEIRGYNPLSIRFGFEA
jgi:hypothetical protein